MAEAYICDFSRSAIGRYTGALKDVRAYDLAAHPIRVLATRNDGIDWKALDDCIIDCANQAGDDNRNVARMAVLLASFPTTVSRYTINRLCGSSFDAVGSAAHAIRSGDAMETLGRERGIATMCIGVGQGIAALTKRV